MITKLTPKQEEMIPVYLKKWLDIGYNTDRFDEAKTKEVMTWAYELAGYQPPEVLIVDSPKAAQELACKLTGVNKIHNNHNYQWYWSNYYGFYDYILNEIFPEKKADFPLLEKIIELNKHSHYFVYFDNRVIVSQRPTSIKVDEEGRLHNELGPALEYADGYKIYALDGIRITEKQFMWVKSKLDGSKIMSITNVEQRLVCIKYFGVGQLLSHLDSKVVDEYKDYKLHEVTIEGDRNKLLEMQNPSEPKKHYEFVPPEITSCKSAMAWRAGLEVYTPPKTYS